VYPKSIQNLIDLFSKFPTIGPRTAARFSFYIMRQSPEKTEKLAKAMMELKEKVKLCNFCFNPFEPGEKRKELCEICSSPSRDKKTLCLVEKESDLESIEETKKYKGLYFILGGTVSGLKKQELEKIRSKELAERVKNPEKFGIEGASFEEIIIATNPTTEGESTALYLERILKPLNKKTTRLGRGLPVGGELEYADQETLSSALDNRK
jgi:recombination protein RecR